MNRRMHLPFAVGLALLTFGCRSDTVSPPFDGPKFAISDGANDGNQFFFFLPPLLPMPTVHPGTFDPNQTPEVQVCDLGPHVAVDPDNPPPPRDCLEDAQGNPVLVAHFPPGTVTVSLADEHYHVNWNTDESTVLVTNDYRIRVLVGDEELGFADVDPVGTGKDLRSVQTGEYIALVDGRTLPIKFRIETGALCEVGQACAAETINLAAGGTIELSVERQGDEVELFVFDIEEGTTALVNGQPVTDVTFYLETCDGDGIALDLRKFGECLQVSTFFDLEGAAAAIELELSNALRPNPLLISTCRLEGLLDLSEAEENYITLHQQDGVLVRALPHATPNCIEEAPPPEISGRWQKLTELASRWLLPRQLHATSRMALINLGAGGETNRLGTECISSSSASSAFIQMAECSTGASAIAPMGVAAAAAATARTVTKFQFAQPAIMEIVEGTTGLTAAAGEAVSTPPAVSVRDANDPSFPVQFAWVTFRITAGDGNFGIDDNEQPIREIRVQTNSDGIAPAPAWFLGDQPGANTVSARGRGFAAAPGDARPFAPHIGTTNEVVELPIPTDLQSVEFTATATVGFAVQTLQSNLEYPKGLWISGDVYLTETADHNTSFGGKETLLRYVIDGGTLQTLLTSPENSDAIVVTGGAVYLASYKGTSPGEVGAVSVAQDDIDVGWTESPVADLAIAAQDMFLDANGDIYVIGPSDNPTATNLYRLPAGEYGSPVGVATGLGRSWSLVKIGADLYYSVIDAGEVRRISAASNTLVFSGVTVTSLTSDGVYLYYGTLDGIVARRNLTTGAVETVTSGPGQITAVRYDAASAKLYFLRSGTADAQYKNGSLNVISLGAAIP